MAKGTRYTMNAKSAGYKSHKQAKLSNRAKASDYKEFLARKLTDAGIAPRDLDGAYGREVSDMYNMVRSQGSLANKLSRVSLSDAPTFKAIRVVDLDTGAEHDLADLGPVRWADFDPNSKTQKYQVVPE